MFGLALHTSTSELGLAISDFETIQRQQTWDLGRDLSSQLHRLLQDFVSPQTWRNFEFIVVCVGPGGFTGTRIGVTTARTLAQQLNISLLGISALAAVAHHYISTNEPLPNVVVSKSSSAVKDIAITMPAKRGAVYGAIYRWTGKAMVSVLNDSVLPASDWNVRQAQWSQPLTKIQLESGAGLAKTVPSLLTLGHSHWQADDHTNWREVVPFYGQNPVTV
ncbi:MAG: tRNA (adenosine(37)-N6)-threonylcarbamoyltransferase complex dimerization subunit type 1 TsaB [Leptolyngbyaceae cyanobacterium]